MAHTLHTGVTSNLITRVFQHKQGFQPGFTKQYGCTKLVYYELLADMLSAIAPCFELLGCFVATHLLTNFTICANYHQFWMKSKLVRYVFQTLYKASQPGILFSRLQATRLHVIVWIIQLTCVVTLRISASEVSPASTRLNPSSRMLGEVGRK